MIFTETWKPDASKFNIERYCNYFQIRPKHKNSIRHSGGITILAKHLIRPGIKLVENTEGFPWFKLDKKTFSKLTMTSSFVVHIYLLRILSRIYQQKLTFSVLLKKQFQSIKKKERY